MPYVERRAGLVAGVYANPQAGYAEEFLTDDDEEVTSFLSLLLPVPSPRLYAVALLTLASEEIGGIGVDSRFSAALWADVGLYYVFFAEAQANTSYLAKAYDDAARVSVIEKSTDYIVIQAQDANGNPVDPAEISIEIIRVS